MIVEIKKKTNEYLINAQFTYLLFKEATECILSKRKIKLIWFTEQDNQLMSS